MELDTKLKPFIPEYIPAVGDIDAFIKVPRPDAKPDFLGLFILDEPNAFQSDPTVLELQLRSTTKQGSSQPINVRGIENADKNAKMIENWIERIKQLHQEKPPPNVNYTKSMPDVEKLMQEWNPEFEKLLETVNQKFVSIA